MTDSCSCVRVCHRPAKAKGILSPDAYYSNAAGCMDRLAKMCGVDCVVQALGCDGVLIRTKKQKLEFSVMGEACAFDALHVHCVPASRYFTQCN